MLIQLRDVFLLEIKVRFYSKCPMAGKPTIIKPAVRYKSTEILRRRYTAYLNCGEEAIGFEPQVRGEIAPCTNRCLFGADWRGDELLQKRKGFRNATKNFPSNNPFVLQLAEKLVAMAFRSSLFYKGKALGGEVGLWWGTGRGWRGCEKCVA